VKQASKTRPSSRKVTKKVAKPVKQASKTRPSSRKVTKKVAKPVTKKVRQRPQVMVNGVNRVVHFGKRGAPYVRAYKKGFFGERVMYKKYLR